MLATVAGVLGAAFLIFLLRVFGVALATVRTLFMTRGMELWSAVLGFFEVLVYVVAIGVVVNDLDNVPNVLGYCLGFSVGTVLGIRIERRLALGYVTVHIVSTGRGREVADALRAAGFGATLIWGEGRSGTVAMIDSVVSRRDAVAAADVAHSADRNAFVAVEQTSTVDRGWMRIARHER